MSYNFHLIEIPIKSKLKELEGFFAFFKFRYLFIFINRIFNSSRILLIKTICIIKTVIPQKSLIEVTKG